MYIMTEQEYRSIINLITDQLSSLEEAEEMNIILNLLHNATERRNIHPLEVINAVVQIFNCQIEEVRNLPKETIN
jgi:hypothetical protein